MKREFLMLAHNFEDRAPKHLGGWYVSEKLDGQRAFWDGGVSRGLRPTDIPWANTAKDSRYLVPPLATGLWTRYGKPIQAPAVFLDQLPSYPLDGELWAGRGNFQQLRSIVSHLVPNEELWKGVIYYCFDAPTYSQVFQDGEINNTNFKKVISWQRIKGFLVAMGVKNIEESPLPFCDSILKIPGHNQQILPSSHNQAKETVKELTAQIADRGGEGLMLRSPISFWTPKRMDTLLKVKPLRTDTASVVGFTWGRETDRGSKHLGRIGALVVSWNEKTFELSGLSDIERAVRYLGGPKNEPIIRAGRQATSNWQSIHFPNGTTVTFTYRELTDLGIPKEARVAE